jgi:8-oxo-dGTP pyrophosphatase MutT (NUDIX family)
VTDPDLSVLDAALKRFQPRAAAPLRPRDAATIILVDRTDPGAPKILFGRRNAKLRFLPNKFVFPGGALDRADRAVDCDGDLGPDCARRLAALTRQRSASLGRALALAAVRELAEETGLYLGVPGDLRANGSWAGFSARGVRPSLTGVRYVARAITPPHAPRRYDTRFFAAEASAIAARDEGAVGPDSELTELAWATPQEARNLDLHQMTAAVLAELERTLVEPAPAKVPFFRVKRGRFVRDWIEG